MHLLNYDLLNYSIKNKKLKFINHLLKNYNQEKTFLKLHTYDFINNIFCLNNKKIIKCLLIDFEFTDLFVSILENVIKLGYYQSFMILLDYDIIINKINQNKLKYMLLCFVSNHLHILKKIISLNQINDNQYLNYNLLYNQSLVNGNIKIVKYLYELNNSLVLNDYLCVERILKNKYYDIFLFVIEKNTIIGFNSFNHTKFNKIINKYAINILLNIDDIHINKFINFIQLNKFKIEEDKMKNLVNLLLSHNQINKLEFIKYKYDLKKMYKL
jgi:hypothetical protein